MIFHSIALSFDFYDACVVEESVEDGGCCGHVSDEFSPFFQGPVGGHECGFQLVASHNDFKKIFS